MKAPAILDSLSSLYYLFFSVRNGAYFAWTDIYVYLGLKSETHNTVYHTPPTPLHFASRFGWIDIASQFLSSGVDINSQNVYFGSPLHVAASEVNQRAVKINAGAGVNLRGAETCKPTPGGSSGRK